MPISPSLENEVAFISSVKADKTLALNGFYAWNGDTPATYTGGYTQAMKWGGTAAGTAGGSVKYYFDPVSKWTSVEKQWLTAGLALWSAVANISFVLTTNSTQAQITFTRGNDGHAGTIPKYKIGTNAGVTGGTVLLQMTGAKISIDTKIAGFGPINGSFSNYGGYPLLTLLHEEGHAIGLGHSGPYNEKVNEATQQFSAYDSMQWSSMSYIDPSTTTAKYYSQYTVPGTYWSTSSHNESVPTTWMPLDILAAQRLYGLPTSTPLSGGQTFGFHCNVTGAIEPFFDFTKNTTPVITIWDMGRNNTLDLSGFSASSTVNLNPGTFSSCDNLANNIAIAFNTSVDTLICGSGNDKVTCNNDGDRITGGAGNDKLTGGSGDDVLDGGSGSDTLIGGGGFNVASYANATGPVTVSLSSITDAQDTGGAGMDTLWYIQGLIGSSYDDTLTGGWWWDSTLDGGPGNDRLTGGNSTYVCTASYADATSGVTVSLAEAIPQNVGGGMGYDTLWGIRGLIGSQYNDTLTGGTGSDTLLGGAGNDTLNGGDGSDTASYGGATSGVVVSLGITTAQAVGGGQGTDTLISIENLIGSNYADTLTGNSSDNILTGGAGNDTLDGGDGSDTAAYSSATSGVTVSLSITTAQAAGGGQGTDTLISIENLTGSIYADTLTGNSNANVLTGGAGNDTLKGGVGNDTLNGGDGLDTASYSGTTSGVTVNLSTTAAQAVGGGQGSDTLSSIENLTGSSYSDTLTGNSGDNLLTSGTGDDTLNGGAGNDAFDLGVYLTAADKIDGGAGTDTLNLRGGYAGGVTFNSTTVKNVEKIVLAAGYSYNLTTNNATVASGQTLTIDGSALSASCVLTFSGAAETDGHFIIISGKGADILTGGTLPDTFTYSSAAQSTGAHYDTITGFKFGVDHFDTPGGAGTITGINTKVASGALSTSTFDANLSTAMSGGHQGAHHAVLFTPNSGTLAGQTFMVVDLNGTAGYQTGQDLVVRLMGQSGTLAAGGFF